MAAGDDAPASPAKAAAADKASAADAKRAVASARDELKTLLAKKRTGDKALATLESTLHAFETSYLAPAASETGPSSFGNIVKGYDQYLKAPNMSQSHHTTFAADRNKRRAGVYGQEVREEERLFSRSSDTYLMVRQSMSVELRLIAQSLDLKERETQGPSSSEEEDVTGSKKRKR